MTYGIFERIGSTTNSHGKIVDVVGDRMFPKSSFYSVAGAYAFWYDAEMGNANRITIERIDVQEVK